MAVTVGVRYHHVSNAGIRRTEPWVGHRASVCRGILDVVALRLPKSRDALRLIGLAVPMDDITMDYQELGGFTFHHAAHQNDLQLHLFCGLAFADLLVRGTKQRQTDA